MHKAQAYLHSTHNFEHCETLNQIDDDLNEFGSH